MMASYELYKYNKDADNITIVIIVSIKAKPVFFIKPFPILKLIL